MNQPQINGHATEKTPQQRAAGAHAQLDVMLEPIIGTLINGTLVTFQGVPADQLARAIARVTGRTLGRVIQQGSIVSVLQVRAAMKEEFTTGMDSITPTNPPANGQPMPKA